MQEPTPVFYVSKKHHYKLFDEDHFRKMVAFAVQNKASDHTQDDFRMLTHNSLQRGVSINQTFPHRLTEALRGIVELYIRKVIDAF